MKFFSKTMHFRFLNANKNVVMRCPLREITPQTTAGLNRVKNTHGSHSAAELILFVFFSPIILACKGIHNGVFLHPPSAPHNWLNAKEVMYFKEIIKGAQGKIWTGLFFGPFLGPFFGAIFWTIFWTILKGGSSPLVLREGWDEVYQH